MKHYNGNASRKFVWLTILLFAMLIILSINVAAEPRNIHCFKVEDENLVLSADISFSESSTTNIANKEVLIVPLGATMRIDNIAKFNQKCENGVGGSFIPTVRIKMAKIYSLEDLSNIGLFKTVATNNWHTGRMSCYDAEGNFTLNSLKQTPTVKGDSSFSFKFLQPGFFLVLVEYAKRNNATRWAEYKRYYVVVMSPNLSIIAPKNISMIFGSIGQTRNVVVPLTIVNSSTPMLPLKLSASISCPQGISCSFNMPNSDVSLLPDVVKDVAVAPIYIKAAAPRQSIVNEPIKLTLTAVATTDSGDEIGGKKTITYTLKISRVLLAKEFFNVKLFFGERITAECRGPNNEIGFSGEDALPKIKLDWRWQSIAMDDCNRFYCDQTQFMISLIKRLQRLNTLLNEGSNLSYSLLNFDIYLTDSWLKQSFREDFYSYAEQLLVANLSDWKQFIKDEDKLRFECSPNCFNLTAGKYSVEIILPKKVIESRDLLHNSVEVKLTKISEPLDDNPFYHIPFNGFRSNDSACLTDYGIGFENEDKPITIVPSEVLGGSSAIKTLCSNGLSKVKIQRATSFEETNITRRGKILQLVREGNEFRLRFAPSKAVTVFMLINKTKKQEIAQGLYYLADKKGNTLPPVDYMDNKLLSMWYAVASTMDCKDFYGNNLFKNRQDKLADKRACVKANMSNSAVGFIWGPTPKSGKLLLESQFYLPIAEHLVLNKIKPTDARCSNAKLFNIDGKEAPFSLENDNFSLNSLFELFELVREGKVCTQIKQDEANFFWNENLLQEIARDRAATIVKNENLKLCS